MPGKTAAGPRRDLLIHERIHDPYRTRLTPHEPAVCPQCRAVFEKNRWSWDLPPRGARLELCEACRRIRDDFPAGILTISGDFALARKEELIHIARHQEELEKKFRPLHRIMRIEAGGAGLNIKTTDIHLPRRIGEALHRAYKGRLEIRYEPETYFIRVNWNR
ncbi:MAG: BCAM0308 family protein [Elusimicrobia bacterium]|nr:BCAM0308 family protein [Elusimicrobiota bacterium]